jgi:hypothetical protein
MQSLPRPDAVGCDPVLSGSSDHGGPCCSPGWPWQPYRPGSARENAYEYPHGPAAESRQYGEGSESEEEIHPHGAVGQPGMPTLAPVGESSPGH